jgi:drug/metabolite transporter (DMT)-like permease
MRDIVNPKNARLLMVVAMSIFGTIGLTTYYIDLPSSIIVAGRGIVGTAFLLLLIVLMGSRLSKEDILGNMFTLVCSGICLGLNWLFLFEAYKTIEISEAIVLNYLTPALTILMTPVFLKQNVSFLKLGCALLALFGLILVSGIVENGMDVDLYGLLCGVLAAVFYTAMILLNKKLKSIGSYDRTSVQLFVAAVVVVIYSLLSVDLSSLEFDMMSIGLVVMLGIVHTAIAFTLYFGSLAYMDAPDAALLGYIEPVLGVLLSVIILHEDLGMVGWIGAAIILGSTFVPEALEIARNRRKG